jgi:dTDP-4-amino-4,6-dideoxygalactose transaminase
MDAVMAIANRHSLRVIEDACQSHGARYKGRRAGSMGAFAAFSFYPSKNLGAYGDGGGLTTNDAELAERVRMMRNYGERTKYEHVFLAWNRRLDTLQAAVLRVKLRHLDAWNQSRRTIASLYGELLEQSSLTLPIPRQTSSTSITSTWCRWTAASVCRPTWRQPKSPRGSTTRYPFTSSRLTGTEDSGLARSR